MLVVPLMLLGLAVGQTGCESALRGPDLKGLYDTLARRSDADRNPVIVIPGITGSRLVDRGSRRVVWGAFVDDYADPRTADGARLLALPMREGAALGALCDDVVSEGVLDRVRLRLLGLPVELRAYAQILATLGVGGYRDEQLGRSGAVDYGDAHFTCFQFDYDWRRDNVENAARLARFIGAKRAYVEEETRRRFGVRREVKFDIVAHSMGGLIARYFLMYGERDVLDDRPATPPWSGARDVQRVVLVGTPSGGSVKALLNLVQGVDIGPTLPRIEAAIVGTMPAVYQLLPDADAGALVDGGDGRSIDFFDPAIWERYGWGVVSPEQDRILERLLPQEADPQRRRSIAREHLSKCLDRARRFRAALDAAAATPAGLEMHLVAGDAEPTPAAAELDAASGRLRIVRKAPGDGTVLRSSALRTGEPPGRDAAGDPPRIEWTGVTFVFSDHLGMTRDPHFADNVLHLLLERRRPAIASAATP